LFSALCDCKNDVHDAVFSRFCVVPLGGLSLFTAGKLSAGISDFVR
jgi:hypothetical protein